MITLDGYADLCPIGAGGLGEVYRATRVQTGDTVAVKVLRDAAAGAARLARRELTALEALGRHPHVIEVVETIDTPDGPAIVMEHAAGGSIADLLARRGSLNVGETVLVGCDAASALQHAHDLGIVHGDVKPHNLLVDERGRVKLCDFGIATLAGCPEFGRPTDARSPRYASPEQLDVEGRLEPSSDVYSLGATLCRLFHGAPPTLRQRLAGWSPTTTSGRAEDAALDAVIASCLAIGPEERPTAREVLERLRAVERTLTEPCRAITAEPEVGRADPLDEAIALLGWNDPHTDATSAPTVVRDDALAPVRAARPDVTRPRRWPYVAGAVACAALVGAGVARWRTDPSATAALPQATGATIATSHEPAAPVATGAAGEAVVTAPRAAGLPPLDPASTVWPFGEVDECLVQVNGLDSLMPIDCGEPHDLQRLAVAELDGDWSGVSGFPAERIRAATEAACRRVLDDLGPVASDDAGLGIAVTRPSEATWSVGDRRYQCLIGAPGRHLVGRARAGPSSR